MCLSGVGIGMTLRIIGKAPKQIHMVQKMAVFACSVAVVDMSSAAAAGLRSAATAFLLMEATVLAFELLELLTD